MELCRSKSPVEYNFNEYQSSKGSVKASKTMSSLFPIQPSKNSVSAASLIFDDIVAFNFSAVTYSFCWIAFFIFSPTIMKVVKIGIAISQLSPTCCKM